MVPCINTNPEIEHLLLKANGNFPNSQWPVLIYRKTILLPEAADKAVAYVQKLFTSHGWSNSWF